MKTEIDFLKNVRKVSNSCWEWEGYKIKNGYGRTSYGSGKILAHRWSYQIYKGEIPAGMVIDHLCRNTSCVNPDHLEAVTQRENCRRGLTGSHMKIVALRRTHCPHGHEYTPENTIPRKSGRFCRRCRSAPRKNTLKEFTTRT